jgi:hypothetical protein
MLAKTVSALSAMAETDWCGDGTSGVVDNDPVTGSEQPGSHRTNHVAQADEPQYDVVGHLALAVEFGEHLAGDSEAVDSRGCAAVDRHL